MSVSMMERVAEAARTLARNAQAEEGRSFRGFRQNTEQLTDRLISAMFPSYAAASLSRESALLEASELLIECLDRVLPPGRDPEAVAGALFTALPEVQRQLQTDLAAAYEGDPAAASVDEIGDLAISFNTMAEAIEQKVTALEGYAKQQKDFVANFSHELKTPMTSIIGYADMLRSAELDEEDAFMASNFIFSEGKRLEALSLKLMDLVVLDKNEFELTRGYARRVLGFHLFHKFWPPTPPQKKNLSHIFVLSL